MASTTARPNSGRFTALASDCQKPRGSALDQAATHGNIGQCFPRFLGYRRAVLARRLCFASVLVACGSPPLPHEPAEAPPALAEAPPARDPCEPVDGKPPAPVTGNYTGVLQGARCQPEVLAIMNGVAKALGTGCDHCHDEMDYAAPSENKRIANWMASELSSRLSKRAGGAVTCADCHADDGKGKAKILGAPRSRTRAVEWMTASLVERFDAAAGGPVYCKTCHVGQLGTPAFQGHVILTEHLPPRSAASPGAIPHADGG
jgi:hypothetical protein